MGSFGSSWIVWWSSQLVNSKHVWILTGLITSRTSINLAKILIIQNTSEYHLQLSWTSILQWYFGHHKHVYLPGFQIFCCHPSPPYLQLSQSQSHQRLDTGTPTEDMLRSHRLPWRCLPERVPCGLEVTLLRKPFLLKQSGCILGGGRNSTHTGAVEGHVFLFLGPLACLRSYSGWDGEPLLGIGKLHSDFLD